jgi:hypothetical protein
MKVCGDKMGKDPGWASYDGMIESLIQVCGHISIIGKNRIKKASYHW